MKDIQKVTKITHNELRAFSNGLEEVLDGFIENNVRITELYALSQEKFVFSTEAFAYITQLQDLVQAFKQGKL